MKLEVTDPKSSSGSLALHPRSGAWAALLEQNMGAAVLHFLSAERSEKDAALSIMSLLSIDRILSFFVCLTQWYPGTQRGLLDAEQTTVPAGAHLSSPGKAGLRSQHWLAKFLAQGLVSLAGEKSPYVSGHQLVGHLQRRSHCIHH